jgi:hypothetical protein
MDVVSGRIAIFVPPETLIIERDSSVVAHCASMLGVSMEIGWRLHGDVRHKSTPNSVLAGRARGLDVVTLTASPEAPCV